MEMAFISRHVPTAKQVELAQAQGFQLVHIGDMDAFADNSEVLKYWNAISCVHPLIAISYLDCRKKYKVNSTIGIFNNVRRPDVDGKPCFDTDKLVVTTF
jgi:hypothetical protein